MSNLFFNIFWILGICVGLFIIFIIGFFVFLIKTEFSPEKKSKLEINGIGKAMNLSQREFTFLTWNIGYAGLGKEMDFFYDGGKGVRAAKEQSRLYFDEIKKVISTYETTDFIFLQEVDVHSKRSWYTDEFLALSEILPKYYNLFVPNYDCRFIPFPLLDPMGRVLSGIASFLRMETNCAEVQYYNAFPPWPKSLFFLKRCYVLLRFSLNSGKDLVILNIHNSAFDTNGALRKHELTILNFTMQEEYSKGNYVVGGGDWNSNPRGFNVSSVTSGDQVTVVDHQIESSFLPGWHFVFDPSQPSNRNVDIPYKKGFTNTTIIDFFVVSPNIEVKSVTTSQLGFSNSDHQPINMGIRLK